MTVAWLKLIPEDGGAIRAAAFGPAPGGAAAAFHFTRSAAADDRFVSDGVDALLQAAPFRPVAPAAAFRVSVSRMSVWRDAREAGRNARRRQADGAQTSRWRADG